MSFPIIVPSDTSTPSQFPTLAELRHDFADQIGTWNTGVISATTPGGEPGRWILVDDLRDDEWDRDQYAGAWVYATTGSMRTEQRRVRRTGYEGPFGALALSRVFDVAGVPTVPSIESQVEITQPLPTKKTGLTKGLNTLINEACDRVWTEARIPFTGNGTSRYSLSNYEFVTTQARVDGIYDWTLGIASTEAPIRASVAPVITTNGATITLETGYSYSTAASFQLKVFVKASRLIYDGDVWGYVATGLVNDTDQVAVPSAWVLPVAMVKGIQYLRLRVTQDKTLSAAEKRDRLAEIEASYRPSSWARAAASVIANSLPRGTANPSQGLTSSASLSTPGALVGSSGWPN